MKSLLISQLDRHGRDRPETTFLRDAMGAADDHRASDLTWGGLRDATAVLARRLRDTLADDVIIMVALPNSAAMYVALLASLAADRTVFPVSPELTDAELHAEARRCRATVVIGVERARKALADQVTVSLGPGEVPLSGEADTDAFATHQGTGRLLLHSSGTTGLPKVVRRSAVSLDAVARNCVEAIGTTADDRVLLALPLFHSYGLEHGLLMPIVAGASVDLHGPFDAQRMTDTLTGQPITIFPGVPFMFEALVAVGGRSPIAPHSLALRRVYSAGGVMPAPVAEDFARRFGRGVGQLYGATEIGSVTFGNPDLPGFNPTSVGRPMTGVDVRVLDLDQPSIHAPLPEGETGHVAVRAPSMFDGYLDDDNDATQDGFFLTGDLGKHDDHGNLCITGRLKLVIDAAGRKVNPMEVEAVLASHPSVREAVVLPLPVTPTINRLRAVVVPAEGHTIDTAELRAYARGLLSGYKVPRVFETRPALPRSALGKVQREALLRCEDE